MSGPLAIPNGAHQNWDREPWFALKRTGSEAFCQSTRLDLDKARWHCQAENGWWQWRSGFVIDRPLVWTAASHARCINAKKSFTPWTSPTTSVL